MTNVCTYGSRSRCRTAGMTLLEVVMTMAVLGAVVVAGTGYVLSAHWRTQLAGVEITARNSMRLQLEELMAVATDNATKHEEAALAVLDYYANADFADGTLTAPGGASVARVTVGEGKLVYLFPITEAAASMRRPAAGTVKTAAPSGRAVGRMTMYLDETKVLPAPGVAEIWRDLGDGDGGLATGFDLNGNGEIEARNAGVTLSALRAGGVGQLGIAQLPIDVEVFFYNNDRHEVLVHSTSRRIVMTGRVDHSSLLEGEGVSGG